MMTKVVRIHRYGGAEELIVDEVALAAPSAGEICVRHEAIGLNYIDVYQRTGLYPLPRLPAVLGVEAAGIVEAIGPDTTGFQVGDRVAYAVMVGAYAQVRLMPAARAIKLPAHVTADTAAAGLLRALTVHMLFAKVLNLSAGSSLLIHSAAGGLGLLLVQWAKQRGITTFGTVGSEAKAELAVSYGLDHAILYRAQDFVARVKELTGGQGVDAAIDGVGGETLVKTLDCVRPFGSIASVGQASGSLPQIALLGALGPGRSLSLSRPSVVRYVSDLATYQSAAADVIALLGKNMRVEIGERFKLVDAVQAHYALESGATSGSSLLIP